jgi:flagellar basal-body rod protein FlgF
VDSGLYTAYSGMRAQSDALEILANNLANLNTAGFKGDRTFFSLLNQKLEDSKGQNSLEAAINPQVLVQKALNTTEGSLSLTGRDLDVAITGNGFLVVKAPQGTRYTRNGNLHLDAQGVLATSDGYPVLGASGNPIKLGAGKIQIGTDGGVVLENEPIDRLKIVTFDNLSTLEKEGSSLFLSRGGQASEKASSATIQSGYLEQSNVNAISGVTQMMDLLRHFEAIQKSINLLMNDINPKVIDKLGR